MASGISVSQEFYENIQIIFFVEHLQLSGALLKNFPIRKASTCSKFGASGIIHLLRPPNYPKKISYSLTRRSIAPTYITFTYLQ